MPRSRSHKSRPHKSRPHKSRSHKSRSHKSRHGRGTKVSNRASKRVPNNPKKEDRPLVEQSLGELQMIARSHGIPFGGLTCTQLIEKIIAYR